MTSKMPEGAAVKVAITYFVGNDGIIPNPDDFIDDEKEVRHTAPHPLARSLARSPSQAGDRLPSCSLVRPAPTSREQNERAATDDTFLPHDTRDARRRTRDTHMRRT